MKTKYVNFDIAILMYVVFAFVIFTGFDTLSVFATAPERTSSLCEAPSAETQAEPVTETACVSETEAVPEIPATPKVNGIPYTCKCAEADGAIFVNPGEFIASVFGNCEYFDTGTGEKVRIGSEIFEFFTDRDYVFARGRCIPFTRAVYKDGENCVNAEELSSLFGLDFDGTLIIGEPSLPESADEFYSADDLYWLSKIIYAESRGEELTGKIAVGNVVLNRVKNDGFPSTVYDVIFDDSCGVQFSPTADGTIYLDSDEESVIAAKLCLEGYTVSDEIFYFVNAAIASDSWVQTNRPYVMAIGSHDFYS